MAESGFVADFKRNFFTGIAALFPIVVTLFLLTWLYRQVDQTIGRGANTVFRQVLVQNQAAFDLFFPGASDEVSANPAARSAYVAGNFPRFIGVLLGLSVVAAVVYLVGKLLRGYIGARLMRAVDRFFTRFPVIKAVYPYARQVADFVFGQRDRRAFSAVVAIQYPRRGVYSLGFLTGEGLPDVEGRLGQDLVTVFVPTSPTPVTGFVILMPPEEVVSLDMTVDEAFRYFITAGVLTAGDVRPRARLPGGESAPGTGGGGRSEEREVPLDQKGAQ